jgi:hypothetical protein
MKGRRHYNVVAQGVYVCIENDTIELTICSTPVWVSVSEIKPITCKYQREKAARILNRARAAGHTIRRIDTP